MAEDRVTQAPINVVGGEAAARATQVPINVVGGQAAVRVTQAAVLVIQPYVFNQPRIFIANS